jgi:hypothetical protein
MKLDTKSMSTYACILIPISMKLSCLRTKLTNFWMTSTYFNLKNDIQICPNSDRESRDFLLYNQNTNKTPTRCTSYFYVDEILLDK